MNTYIIPCGAGKQAQAANAVELYVGTMFQHTLKAARACVAADVADGGDAQILIMSAKYGLIKLDDFVQPYECKMGSKGSVTADFVAAQVDDLWIGDDVYAFLPNAYFEVLDTALRTFDIYAHNVYEGSQGGIGEQRRVNRCAQM